MLVNGRAYREVWSRVGRLVGNFLIVYNGVRNEVERWTGEGDFERFEDVLGDFRGFRAKFE